MALRLRLSAFFLHLMLVSLMANGTTVDKAISGVVYGDGEPLIGATIAVKGTSKGTITDIDGKFELSGIPEDAEVLVISYTGYTPMEMEIGTTTFFEITLSASNIVLDEVVVTSFGIERAKKALGYAVQDVDAAELAIEAMDTISMNKWERDYLRYYFYYKSIVDTANSRYKEGYENNTQYIHLADLVTYYQNLNTMRLLETEYQVKERIVRIDKQETLISSQRKTLLIIIVCLVIFIALSVALVYAFRKIRSKNLRIETILRELHHRVKNNLQIVSSLLSLQSEKLSDESAKKAVSEGQERVRAMSLIHQKLYLDDRTTNLNIKDYLLELTADLAHSYGFYDRGELVCEVEDTSIDADLALPLGLIVNELVSNAFKYAFAHTARPRLALSLRLASKKSWQLIVQDNGRGLPAGYNPQQSTSFGMKLVNLLVNQLEGTLRQVNENGLRYTIEFKA